METRKLIERIALTIFVFSLLAGIYIILVSFFRVETLTIQLSHLTPWIREDTFGVFSFIVSFFSFLIWNLTRE